jgi:hypothetical protein
MMETRKDIASVMEDVKIPVRLKLAASWTSYMFVYVYADVLGIYIPGTVEDILAGRVWQFEISQTWAFGALAMSLVPIMMVFLSLVLPVRANRRTNIIVASVYVILSVGNALGESWVYYYGLAALAEVAALGLIIWCARTLPRTDRQQ